MRAYLSLGLMALAAAGGYFQMATQPVFWCGRAEAFPNTLILAAAALGQAGLYLASQVKPLAWAQCYRWSQILLLPLLAFALGQVALPYPGSVALFLGIALLCVLARLNLPAAGLFATAALGFFAAFGQIPFSLPGVIVRPWHVALAGIAALGCALWAARAVPPRKTRLEALAPLSLLLFPVLRAKLPDLAYDSLSYKATIPYQMADWLTGGTAVIDGYMVGTNLQEMLNALLIVVTHDWLPPLISCTSYILLALVLPLAFPAAAAPHAATRAVRAFAGLSAFVLTEASIAQGTTYQEPLMLLFLAASVIPSPAWPAFLAMAVAVKINAAFISPVIALHHLRLRRSIRPAPRLAAAGVLAIALVIGPQLGRNVAQSGRLLGMSEALATITDPPTGHPVMLRGETRYDQPVRGGIVNNALAAACNMWLLDGLCPVRYQGTTEAGFNVFPASRAPLWTAAFLLAACLARRRSAWLTAAVLAACYAAFLSFLSEDRYFLPMSFGFAVVLLMHEHEAADTVRRLPRLALGIACLLIGADLIPGTFTNTSWICARDVLTPARHAPLRGPDTPVQTFLANRVAQYRRTCPPPGLPPVILAEDDRLNSPYLGTQRIFHVFSQAMLRRFLAADPARQVAAAEAMLAVVAGQSSGYPQAMLGPGMAGFEPCWEGDGLRVLCSMKLAPAAPACARSLY